METNMVRLACALAGGRAKLAAAVDPPVSAQAVYLWVKKGKLPAERVLDVERATGGLVTRYQLRPDIYPLEDRPA